MYGASLMAEVIQDAVGNTMRNAINERKERPAFEPKVALPEDKEEIGNVIAGNSDLEYNVKFEVLPEFEVVELGELTVQKQVADVEDAEIAKRLDDMAEENTSYDKKEGEAETGDQVIADYEGRVDGEVFDGGEAEDAYIVIGEERLIPGFEEGLEGAKAGDSVDVNVTFPEDYQASNLAGKDAVFTVKVKEVGSPSKPDIDDEFARTIGFDDLEGLRDALRSQLEDEMKSATRGKMKRALLDILDEAHDFELPPTLLEEEFNGIWGELEASMARSKKTFADMDDTEEEMREKYHKMALRRVKLGLIIADIGDKNEIKITNEEIQQAMLSRARHFPGQEKMVFEFYQKNPEAMASLRAPIFEDKVVDFVLELVKVEESKVTTDELFAEDGDEV
jgi:trigger factor